MKSMVLFKFIMMPFVILHLSKVAEVSSSSRTRRGCYTFHDVASSWNEARKACHDMGAHLVTMEDTEEWNLVKGFIADKISASGGYTHYYIGLRKQSGTWKWTEAGSPGVTVATDDSRWQPNQPSTAGRNPELCGEIWYPNSGTQGHFNNVMCDSKYTLPRGYICEDW